MGRAGREGGRGLTGVRGCWGGRGLASSGQLKGAWRRTACPGLVRCSGGSMGTTGGEGARRPWAGGGAARVVVSCLALAVARDLAQARVRLRVEGAAGRWLPGGYGWRGSIEIGCQGRWRERRQSLKASQDPWPSGSLWSFRPLGLAGWRQLWRGRCVLSGVRRPRATWPRQAGRMRARGGGARGVL